MKPEPNENQDATFDDLNLRSVSTLERQIVALSAEVSATDGALSACKASLANMEVLLDGARAQADATGVRLNDAKSAAASVLGALKAGAKAVDKSGKIRDQVYQLLSNVRDAAELVVGAVERIDELVSEVQTYGKNHYVPAALMDGVTKAEQSSQALMGAMVEAVEAAMNAYLNSWNAESAAQALDRQAREVWTQLDSSKTQPVHLKGISQLELGDEGVNSMETLAAAVSSGPDSNGLLHILKDTHAVLREQELEREAAVTQGRLEVNTLEQRLATQKAALRSAQLALEGAQATLGTAF